jgi:sugar phosphate isomerase/epimerase
VDLPADFRSGAESCYMHGMKQTLASTIIFILMSFGLICSSNRAATPNQHNAGTGASFKGPIGLQLYSLRDQFAKDVPATLDQVRAMGFRNVELAGTYGQTPEKFKELLDSRGLKAISAHEPYEVFRDHVEDVAREAKIFGSEYVGCAWIPHKDPFDEKTCREAISVFNQAGEALAKHGLRFFYHVHGYEFQPYKGGTLLDLIMKETNPQYVHFEMDVFWIVHPGQDPVKLLQKYSGRWELMHIKDMKKGTPTGLLNGNTDVSNDVTIGTGTLDWPGILSTAHRTGVRWYFIEDESPTSAEQIPQSLRYLEQIRF